MSIFRRRRDTHSSASRRVDVFVVGDAPESVKGEDSDVFVARRVESKGGGGRVEPVDIAAIDSVTLFVFGWHNVEPGPLSWAFPSLRAALSAVRTMKNAAQWCIVRGAEHASIEAARANGAVLVEELG